MRNPSTSGEYLLSIHLDIFHSAEIPGILMIVHINLAILQAKRPNSLFAFGPTHDRSISAGETG